ncbi:MAG: TolB-like translocation protein [Bacillota bacterium]
MPATRPKGSPDSGVLLYWRGANLLALDLASWTETKVATVKGARTAASSADGSRCAVLRDASASAMRRQLVLIDRVANSLRRIPCASDASRVQWSPYGRYLAVASGPPGRGKVAIYDAKEWPVIAEADQTSGLFSLDNRFYAYTFDADPEPSTAGARSSGIGLIDLTGKAPVKRTIFDGRDSYAYRVREWVREGLLYERAPASQGWSGQALEYGLVTPEGEVTSLRPKDPWLQLTEAGAAEKVATRFPDVGSQLDLSGDRHWLLFSRPIDGVEWVFSWDMRLSADPVALVPGKGGAWLTAPRLEAEYEAFPYYTRAIDPTFRLLKERDLGSGYKLLEVTDLPLSMGDSVRMFYVHDDVSGMYYGFIGPVENARFIRQDGTRLIFRSQGGGGSPYLSFPYEIVFDLESKQMERRQVFIPASEVVRFSHPGAWPQVLLGVTGGQEAFTFELKPAEGAVMAGSWHEPWTVSSYDEGTRELTLVMQKLALGPGLKANEEMCLDTGDELVRSVTLVPDGEDLKVVFKFNRSVVWNSAGLRIVGDRQAHWNLSFKPAP